MVFTAGRSNVYSLWFPITQVDAAENDDEVKVVFAIDEAASLLHETGFRKPTCRLSMSDKSRLRSALVDYHCMLKVKAAMDQFAEGLQELGVLQLIKQYPELMKPLFVPNLKVLTAGMLMFV